MLTQNRSEEEIKNRARQLIDKLELSERELGAMCWLVSTYPAEVINTAEAQVLDFKDSIRNRAAYLVATVKKKSNELSDVVRTA